MVPRESLAFGNLRAEANRPGALSLSLLFAFLLAIYALAAARTVADNRFLNDDLEILSRASKVYDDPSLLVLPDHSGRNHPLLYLFMGALERAFGLEAFPYYLTLLTLHLGVAAGAAMLAKKAGLGQTGSVFAALVFAVPSLHFQSVGWIGSIAHVMTALLMIASLLSFERGVRTGSRPAAAASLAFWILALLTNEEAMVLPFLLAAYDRLILRRAWRETLRAALPLAAFAGIYLAFQLVARRAGTALYVGKSPDFFPKCVGLIWTFANLFIPRRDLAALFASPFARMSVAALFAVPAFVAGARSFRQAPADPGTRAAWIFGLFWFAAAFAPFALRPCGEWRVYPHPRYLYLPWIGAAVAAAALAERVWSGVARSGSRLAAASLILAFGYFYVLNVRTYSVLVDKMEHEAGRAPALSEPARSS